MRISLKLLVGVGLSVSLSAAIGACSDSTVVTPPVDGSIPETSVAETGPKPDVGTPDTGSDASEVKDSGLDAFDGYDGFVPYTAMQFRDTIVNAYCARAQNTCCAGKPFDVQTCKTILDGGYENSTFQLDIANVDQKNIVVDLARANACINGITSQACADKGITAASLKTVTQDCFAALKGIGNVDDPCHADVECKPGSYCEGGFDPNTNTYPPAGGTCQPLKQLGEACHPTDSRVGDNCSTRGSGDSNRYCGPGGTCVALIANDDACFLNNRCSSGACDPSSFANGKVLCKANFTDTRLCTYFAPAP